MLSKTDIAKELGRNINIHPFKEDNLKENSYNLTASSHAWATRSSKSQKIKKGFSCIKKIDGNQKIVLLPLSTTLIITAEVIGIGNLGGTYHSKVGLASLGLGHIGTMLGPNFCGHSLIAIHNISEETKHIGVGDTFASVVFHKLDSPTLDSNSTINAHIDKYVSLGVKENFDVINEDWKSRIRDISDKMKESESFKNFKSKMWRYKRNELKAYVNFSNFLVVFVILILMLSPQLMEFLAEKSLIEESIKERYIKFFFNIGLSGVFVLVFQVLYSRIKPK